MAVVTLSIQWQALSSPSQQLYGYIFLCLKLLLQLLFYYINKFHDKTVQIISFQKEWLIKFPRMNCVRLHVECIKWKNMILRKWTSIIFLLTILILTLFHIIKLYIWLFWLNTNIYWLPEYIILRYNLPLTTLIIWHCVF